MIYQITAPWGQWKRGDQQYVIGWLVRWLPLIDSFKQGHIFKIEEV